MLSDTIIRICYKREAIVLAGVHRLLAGKAIFGGQFEEATHSICHTVSLLGQRKPQTLSDRPALTMY